MTPTIPHELPVPDFSRVLIRKKTKAATMKPATRNSQPLQSSHSHRAPSFLGLGKKNERPSQEAAISKNKKELRKIDAELARIERAIKNVEN